MPISVFLVYVSVFFTDNLYKSLSFIHHSLSQSFIRHFGDPKQDGRGPLRVSEALRHHNGTIDVVLLGDSVLSHIQLNKTLWDSFHRKYKAMNLGSPRDRSEHLLFRLSNKEITQPIYDARFVVVMIGTNNVEIKESVQVTSFFISSTYPYTYYLPTYISTYLFIYLLMLSLT